MAFYLILIVPYLIGFLILAFLPGWRSLLLFSTAAFVLGFWAFGDASQGDGIGMLLAVAVIASTSLGFFAGFLARAIVLASRWFGWAATSKAALTLPLVLIGVFASTAGWYLVNEQLRRLRHAPPSLACSQNTHAARLGNVMLDIPIAPVVRVGTGPEYEQTYIFDINQHARAFCEEAISSPPSLTSISVDLSWYSNRGLTQKNFAFCGEPREYDWWAAACKRDERELANYPQSMTVYVIGEYNAAKMQARSAESSARYRSKMAGLPTRTHGNGAVIEHVGQHRSYFTRSDSAEYFVSKRADGRDLYCSTGYALPEGLGLIYDFHTKAEQFAEESMRIDQAARAMFQSLVRP